MLGDRKKKMKAMGGERNMLEEGDKELENRTDNPFEKTKGRKKRTGNSRERRGKVTPYRSKGKRSDS